MFGLFKRRATAPRSPLVPGMMDNHSDDRFHEWLQDQDVCILGWVTRRGLINRGRMRLEITYMTVNGQRRAGWSTTGYDGNWKDLLDDNMTRIVVTAVSRWVMAGIIDQKYFHTANEERKKMLAQMTLDMIKQSDDDSDSDHGDQHGGGV